MRIQFGSKLPPQPNAQPKLLQFGSTDLASDTVLFSSTGVKKPGQREIKKPPGTNKPIKKP